MNSKSLFIWLTSTGLYAIVIASNARKLGKVFRVEPGHSIQIRDWTVSVSVSPAGSDRSSEEEVADEQRDIYCLTWKSDVGRQYLQLANERMLVVGRRKPARLVLNDGRLSSAHCGVIRAGQKLWAIDLGSANGTWSKSARHRVHEIELDKSICIGQQRLHFTRLSAAHVSHATTDETDALQRTADKLRSELATAQNDAAQRQVALLTSLRLAEQQSDELKSQHEEIVERHERLRSLYQQESDQHQDEFADMQREHAELIAELESKRETVWMHEETLRELTEANESLQQQCQMLEDRNEALVQQKIHGEAEFANREMEFSLREKEIDRLTAEVAEQRSETEQLQAKLMMERRILGSLELELGQHELAQSTSDTVDDEHLVASPEFHSILDEALDALPRLDES